ncbi:MAG: hypothetical protein U9M90_03015 [Patescibacteria group bacterium]|nr:hypothetical protein [Patescibacteria group bacterium]
MANKVLITGKIKSWQRYLFYVSFLSLFSLLLAPFGLAWPGFGVFLTSFFAGVIFFGYLGFLFSALRHSTASRVFVLTGAVSAIATLLLASLFLGDTFNTAKILGILMLVFGGFFISFKFYRKRFFSSYKKVILAGILYAVALVVLKHSFDSQNFISGYIYSRLGIVAMAGLSLTVPSFRKKVFPLFKKGKRSENASQFALIAAVKSLAGVATALLNYAIAIGSVTIISALVSVQYLFVFALSIIFGFLFQDMLRENMNRTNVLTKALGVVSIVAGVFLVTIK